MNFDTLEDAYDYCEENNSKLFAKIAGLMDSFQCADDSVSIYRNCRTLAVGKIEWLIYKGKKIWHIGNIISFDYNEIKELSFSLESGYCIYLKG